MYPKGYADDLAIYTDRVKTACEILNDATSVSYFSWDAASLTDNGLHQMSAILSSNAQIVPGYINEGRGFYYAGSFVSIYGYSMLGLPDQACSTSIWIKPSQWGGTFIHMSNRKDGVGYCVVLLGLSDSGISSTAVYDTGESTSIVTANTTGLPLNRWTHLVARILGSTSQSYRWDHLEGIDFSAFLSVRSFSIDRATDHLHCQWPTPSSYRSDRLR